jgi:hypothetical protein
MEFINHAPGPWCLGKQKTGFLAFCWEGIGPVSCSLTDDEDDPLFE